MSSNCGIVNDFTVFAPLLIKIDFETVFCVDIEYLMVDLILSSIDPLNMHLSGQSPVKMIIMV